MPTKRSTLEPRESRFYGIRGEIELANENPRGAIGYLEKATARDPGYFKPLLLGGIANYEAGNRSAAAPLLEKSMTLLPTAPAAYYLGRVNEDGGNKTEAVRLYRMIAGANSQLGREASARLSRLGAGQTAGGDQSGEDVLAIQPRMDKQGRVWLAVVNRANVPVTGVSIIVGVVDRSGRTVDGPVRIGTGAEVIAAGAGVSLHTPLGPFSSSEALRYVKWRVERVRAAQ